MTVYLDANCVIYLVELNPIWAPKLLARVSSLRSAGSRVAVGDLARTECLAQPLLKGMTSIALSEFQFHSDLTLGRFRRRPPISALPLGLKRDIRAYFGSYANARGQADDLLSLLSPFNF